jgi:uncharacterized protein (TIGR00645 family)
MPKEPSWLLKKGLRIENCLEEVVFASRWLIAPLYVGLVLGLGILLIKFAQEFWHLAPNVFSLSESDVVLHLLSFVDMSLIANLILMVIFCGYENFVSKIDVTGHVDRPPWMGKVDVSGLKLRLIASIVAISSIKLLKAFADVRGMSDRELAWLLGIHFTFVISGVLLAVMTRMEENGTKEHGKERAEG